MTPLVPIAMFGWLVVSILLFANLPPGKATLIAVLGGFLFLPVAAYDLPGLPAYDKYSAIAIGLILGSLFSGSRRKFPLRMTKYDIPMILWCFISPIATSLFNGLGIYDGISGLLEHYLNWGVFYWVGRRYFGDPSSLRMITRGILIGGIIYFPLILFEVRMSPQLNVYLYGFFAHDFSQHVRYGGYRPIVFMKSGLMVSLWMSMTSILAFWMWRTKEIKAIKGVSMGVIFVALMVATVLCKSADGIVFMLFGLVICLYFLKVKSTRNLRWVLLFIPLYISFRLSNLVSNEQIQALALKVFDAERVDSLGWRLLQEILFGARALERPVLGWGGYNRGWPINQETGAMLIQMVDSLWIILFSSYGFVGLVSVFLALGVGPWCVFFAYRRSLKGICIARIPFAIDAIVLSLVVSFFLLDSLLNSMETPVYILCSGALVSYWLQIRDSRVPVVE